MFLCFNDKIIPFIEHYWQNAVNTNTITKETEYKNMTRNILVRYARTCKKFMQIYCKISVNDGAGERNSKEYMMNGILLLLVGLILLLLINFFIIIILLLLLCICRISLIISCYCFWIHLR